MSIATQNPLTANLNPEFGSIQDVTEMSEVKVVQKAGPPIPTDGTWTVAPGAEVELVQVPTEASHEHYYMPTFEGEQTEADEEFRYFFLSDKGHFDRFSTNESDFKKFVQDLPGEYVKDVSATWTAPKETGAATLWFIMTDRRGGTAWRTVKVIIEK